MLFLFEWPAKIIISCFSCNSSSWSSVNIPVVAIGGIDGVNVLQLKGTGIVGAAVVSGIFAQDDIETATKDLYNKIGEII